MSEAKHTPGPWKANDWTVTSDPKDLRLFKWICMTATNKESRTDEAAANARLIAAAPELLAACKAAYDFLEKESYAAYRDGRHGDEAAFKAEANKLRTAIAIAQGETK